MGTKLSLCEQLLAKKPYFRDFDDEDCRAKLDKFMERIIDHLWYADNQVCGEHPKKEEDKSYKKDSQGNKVKRTPEERAPKCHGIKLFSQKAKVMRMNPLDLIEILGEYATVTYGIYYRNGYPDIPMLLQ